MRNVDAGSPRPRHTKFAVRRYEGAEILEEAAMGDVMIKCPHTGQNIATGLRSDDASFRRMPVFSGRTLCPICRIEHDWFAREAWVAADSHGRQALVE